MTNPLHISHPANLFGRDYIVGDIHGCFDKLEIALHIDTGGWMKDGKTDRSFYLYEVPK